MEPFEMFTLTVNAACIVLLLLMTVLLSITTRFRGANGYAAMIIALTTVPVYFYNICRIEYWYDAALFVAPLAYSVNTLLMPLLWLFTKRTTNPEKRFRMVELLHFMPAIVSFVLYLTVSVESATKNMDLENVGRMGLISAINLVILVIQILVYYPVILVYLRRLRRELKDNCSDAKLFSMDWIGRFNLLTFVFLLVIYVAYALDTRTDTWFPQILNVILMGYLVYKSLLYPTEVFVRSKPVADSTPPSTDNVKLAAYADTIMTYLDRSEAFVDPDFSLHQLAEATGISINNVSKSINVVCRKSFFDLINGMRVGKAKRLLADAEYSSQTIEALAVQCGFRSRTSFYEAFQRIEQSTPARWKKTHVNSN